MTLTPLLPDTAGPSTYGGNAHVNPDPVIDDDSELDAKYWNRLVTDVAGGVHTNKRAMVRCTVAAGVITLADHDAVWGDGSGVAPSVARTSAGLYTVTWATSYPDLQSVPETHPINIRFPKVSAYNASAFVAPTVTRTSANVLTVRCFDAAGVATDCTEFTAEWR